MVTEIFTSPIGEESFTIILGTLAFGVQIYCDFSGYSDIALGAATIMGFKIPINFNRPYFASSPSDFWRRWHISLSTWLRDYLYIPLGGNRKGRMRAYVNLMLVMLLGGLWHGAAWNFMIWGALHGSYLAIHRMISDKFYRITNNSFVKSRYGVMISIIITQYFVFLAWIAFRVENFESLSYSIYKFIVWDLQTEETISMILHQKIPLLLIVIFFVFNIITHKKDNLLEKIVALRTIYWTMILTGILTSILFFFNGKPQEFIYFRF